MNRDTRMKIGGWMGTAAFSFLTLTGCSTPVERATPAPSAQATTSNESVRSATTAAPESPLAGTEWRLVAIQSMDDSVGTTRPDDPTKYTMRLNSDGSVQMRLNCNSANGKWSAKAAPGGSSGSFEFGPLAGTRALCPPPSLDERVTAQSQYVRSYLLKQGRLSLSLMADGGIFIWEPHPDVPFLTEPDKQLEEAILRAEPSYAKAMVDSDPGQASYVYGRVDLNGDGRDEVFVSLLGMYFCGTGGCNLLLFTENQNGYSLLNRFSTTRIPVFVSAEKIRGWRNILWLKSGGGGEPAYLNHTFNGKRYVEGSRLTADKEPAGLKYLAGELTFAKAIPLSGKGSPSDQKAMMTEEQKLRARDEVILQRFQRLQGEWKAQRLNRQQYLDALRELQAEEEKLFEDVKKVEFRESVEHNYWHRGRMKFPSQVAQEINLLTQ